MSTTHDAVIVGAGIVGTAIGLELARRGWRTLNVDKLPAAGYGPTGASCAIIRPYYSTVDGAAMAYEGYFHWKDWPGYLGVDDERGLAVFNECGCLVMRTKQNGHLLRILQHMDELGIPYEPGEAGQLTFDFKQKDSCFVFEFRDDGRGISKENLDKIFDPFFTTKRGQGGSGLGLHIIYNLVTQKLDGTIRCESKIGNGTKFVIEIPASS